MKLRLRRPPADSDELPRTPRATRVLIAVAALTITLVIGIGLLAPHLAFVRAQRSADPVRPCAPGQAADCVGGTMGVIVAPPASSARH
jgi:hypothetical protein